jgi:hypothetical protein
MKYFFFTLFITVFFYTSRGQSSISGCSLLQKVINNKKFNNDFHTYYFENQSLTLIDTTNSFKDCIIQDTNGHKVEFGQKLSNEKKACEIFISHIEKGKIKTVLGFVNPYTNVYIEFELTVKKKHIKIKILESSVM